MADKNKVTKRLDVNRPLTFIEGDQNLQEIKNVIDDQQGFEAAQETVNSNLQTQVGTAQSDIDGHKAAGNPHSQYALTSELEGNPANGEGALKVRGSVIYVDTIADLQALPTSELVGGQVVEVSAAGSYTWDSQASDFVARNSDLFTYRIPEDFSNLQSAFESLTSSKIPSAGRFIIQISSGHVIQEGLYLKEGDYSAFRITSEDAEVSVGSGLTDTLLKFEHCIAPALQCLFNQNGYGLGGVLYLSSFGYMFPGSGVKNAGNRGLEVATSVVDAFGSIWDGAGGRGVRVSNGGVCKIRSASAQNCGEEGLAVSGARVDAQDSDFSNCTGNNIAIVSASSANLDSVTATGSAIDNLVVSGGSVAFADSANLINALNRSVVVSNGGSLSAPRADMRGSVGGGALVNTGGYAVLRLAQISDSLNPCGGSAVHAATGATVIATGAICDDAAQYGVRCESSARVVFDEGSAQNGGTDSYFVDTAGSISMIGAAGVLPNAPINTISEKGYIISDVVTKNKGAATMPAGATLVTVNHGLGISPFSTDVSISLRGDLGTASHVWIGSVGSESFEIRVDSAPGIDVPINWSVSVRDR